MRRPLPKKVLPYAMFDRESSEFDRSLGFFDATYAFALTLLILNIDLPPEAAWQSVPTLLAAVSWQAIGFVTSFIVIIIFWLANSGIIGRLRTLDQGTIMLNIVVVGLIVFIPFTTQAISDPGLQDLPLPTVVYAINVAAAIIVQTIMYERAISKGFGRFPVSPRTRKLELIDSLGNPFVFLLSIPISLALGGVAGKISWLLMIPVGIITGRIAAKSELADFEAAGTAVTDGEAPPQSPAVPQ